MYGNPSDPSVTYRYGAKAPIHNLPQRSACPETSCPEPLVWEQLRAAHRYRNKLVEIERRRRDRSAAFISSAFPQIAELENCLVSLESRTDVIRTCIKIPNAMMRKQLGTKEDRAEPAAIKADKKQIYASLKSAKKVAYKSPESEAALKAINNDAELEHKAARKACNCGWGTYLAVEQSLTGIRSGAPPKFLSWRGNGKLAVQIQKKKGKKEMTVEEAGVGDTWLRIEFTGGKCANVWMRVDSDEKGNPIWVIVPTVFHRPLPRDAKIKWVYLTARRIACHTEWSVCFVLSRKAGWQKADLAYSGSVGIDLGWRITPNGLRVAYWRGNDGDQGGVLIPCKDLSRWKKAEDVRSIRDQHFDVARDALAAWLRDKAVPDWLAEKTQHLRQWRSTARLAVVVLAWREQRFKGDAESYAVLEAWRKKDKHLFEWEANQRRKAVAWREHLYRNLAAELSRRYKNIVVEDADWKDIGRLPDAGESAGNQEANRNRVIASPGLLRRFVKERFADYTEVKAAGTTRKCSGCGKSMGRVEAGWTSVTCPHCGRHDDRDGNAAANILASGAVA